ncbi:MAG: histidine--tRNA ligase [Alphaproteobacteria bacterium]|nr:histidine--tRNA ligase [Alphaproteobacteria bacterium]MCD8571373.1 histidine--tRNA ligase [Alphaproteobacteria bacterium]
MSDQQKKKIHKPTPISGFPEWLPEVRVVEQSWMDHIRRVFESYGYCSIETPAVEELAVIAAKGEDVDKEIYVLERLQADPDDKKDARLALHFDQTVPFARYVAMHFNELVFPFKRYQMQKVWRGERPQAGRMREFYQCDIDVINPDNLPIAFDGEMPAIIWEILSSLPGMENEKIQIRVSNRKILLGFLDSLQVNDPVAVTRIIDKIEKIGGDEVKRLLSAECGLSGENITKILDLVRTKDIKNLSGANTSMQEGVDELSAVMDSLAHLPKDAVVADLSIVRGLDYYTGTVYETVFLDDPTYGSICSGGRYDDLAGSYINKHLPGVGISIGFTRLFDRLRAQGKLPVSKKSPTEILVMPPRDADAIRSAYDAAHTLRRNGWNVEVAPGRKFDKQMSYAEKKGIRYIWFVEDGEVQDRETREKTKAAPADWKKS